MNNNQDPMIGLSVTSQASANARSSKVNDRERRTMKRSEKGCWRLAVKRGEYNASFRP